MSTPYLAAGPLAIDLNQPGTYLHWSIFNVSVANLVLIAVMVVIFGAALVLPFAKGKTYPPQQAATGPATGEPLADGQAAATAEPASDAGAQMWTARVRRAAVRLLPPGKLLPDRQPAYVASWAYVFGVASLAALGVAIVSGFALALGGPDWWHYNPVGHFFNSLHLWSVELFMALLVIHLWAKFWMAAWRGRRAMTWITGVVAFVASIVECFTGYLPRPALAVAVHAVVPNPRLDQLREHRHDRDLHDRPGHHPAAGAVHPGLRDIPRLIAVHRLIWRSWDHPEPGPSGPRRRGQPGRREHARKAGQAMSTPIVAATDGSEESLAATQWAAVAAARRGARLCIVHIVDCPGLASPAQPVKREMLRHGLPHHTRSVLARASRRAAGAAPGIDMHAVAVYGHADQVLTAMTARVPLLVIGTRGAGRSPGQRLGSVARRLAGQARCPVVLVTADTSPAFDEIVVGTDGSDDAAAALEFGFGEAELRHAQLTALYIWAHPQAAQLESNHDWMLSVGPANPNATARLAQEVAPWQRRHPGVLVTEDTVHGEPGRVLAFASGHADLIVVDERDGTTSAPGPGSVAAELLQHTRCPVAVIP